MARKGGLVDQEPCVHSKGCHKARRKHQRYSLFSILNAVVLISPLLSLSEGIEAFYGSESSQNGTHFATGVSEIEKALKDYLVSLFFFLPQGKTKRVSF